MSYAEWPTARVCPSNPFRVLLPYRHTRGDRSVMVADHGRNHRTTRHHSGLVPAVAGRPRHPPWPDACRWHGAGALRAQFHPPADVADSGAAPPGELVAGPLALRGNPPDPEQICRECQCGGARRAFRAFLMHHECSRAPHGRSCGRSSPWPIRHPGPWPIRQPASPMRSCRRGPGTPVRCTPCVRCAGAPCTTPVTRSGLGVAGRSA